MSDIVEFGRIIVVVSGGLSIAILVRVIAARIGLPTAAPLLVAAAVASEVSDRLASLLSFVDVQRIATLALIVILFDGGMSMGLARFRSAAVPITVLGVLGTFGTAPLVGVAAHYVLGFDWTVALLLGAALAPTDPAVTFSVLAGKEVEGRSGTILEGESGFNDPVGIALMIGMVELATVPDAGAADVVWEFLREMGIGLAEGAVAGFVLLQLIRRVPLPDTSLYPLAVVLLAGLVYGIAAVSHGSGFLAVFVAGIVIGDAEFPSRVGVRHFVSALADLGELAVFVALGLTIDLGFIFAGAVWWQGLILALLLGFVVRPLVVTPLLLPARLTRGERLFVTWAGLKGAVPDSPCVARGRRRHRPGSGDLRNRVRRRALLGRRPGNPRPHRGAPSRRAHGRRGRRAARTGDREADAEVERRRQAEACHRARHTVHTVLSPRREGSRGTAGSRLQDPREARQKASAAEAAICFFIAAYAARSWVERSRSSSTRSAVARNGSVTTAPVEVDSATMTSPSLSARSRGPGGTDRSTRSASRLTTSTSAGRAERMAISHRPPT